MKKEIYDKDVELTKLAVELNSFSEGSLLSAFESNFVDYCQENECSIIIQNFLKAALGSRLVKFVDGKYMIADYSDYKFSKFIDYNEM